MLNLTEHVSSHTTITASDAVCLESEQVEPVRGWGLASLCLEGASVHVQSASLFVVQQWRAYADQYGRPDCIIYGQMA